MHGGLSKKDLLPRYSKGDSVSSRHGSSFFAKLLKNLYVSAKQKHFLRKQSIKSFTKKRYAAYAFFLGLILLLFICKSALLQQGSSPLSSNQLLSQETDTRHSSTLVSQDSVLNNYLEDDMKDSKLNMEKAKELLLNQMYAKEQGSLNEEKDPEAAAKGSNNGNDIKALKQSDDVKNKQINDNKDPPFKKTQSELDKQKSKEDSSKQHVKDKKEASYEIAARI